MAALKSYRVICGALILLALPAVVTAQTSTFVLPFERVGTPGTEVVTVIDPLNPAQTIQQTNDIGAFINPCTAENVDVRGTSTISTAQSIDKFGNLKVNVSEITKGTGAGWVALNGAQSFTGATYAFNQNISVDLGYTHIFIRDSSIDETFHPAPTNPAVTGTLHGDYENSVDILAVQANFKF